MSTKTNPLPFEDEVLRRMLSSKPKPHKAMKATPAKKTPKKAPKTSE